MPSRRGSGRAGMPAPCRAFLLSLLAVTTAWLFLPPAGAQDAQALAELWSRAYGLEDKLPPQSINLGSTPRGPHLQRCSERATLQQELEGAEISEELPAWAAQDPGCPSCVPPIPWVRGPDSSNLPSTRETQRDLWLWQFPRGPCADRRLLVAAWPPVENFGIGAQLHIMSAALSLALESNRTLVPLLGSYRRADHPACADLGHRASLSCYFSPPTSGSCQEAALKAVQAGAALVSTKHSLRGDLAGPAQVVSVGPTFGWSLRFKHCANAAERWGTPWLEIGRAQRELLRSASGRASKHTLLKVSWWRSQSVRFFLRWPSAYLCHLTNVARHHAYGTLAAAGVARALAEQAEVRHRIENRLHGLEADAEGGPETRRRGPRFAADAAIFRQGFAEQGSEGGRVAEGKEEGVLGGEAYIPRPVVSVHVRQGDKGKEMKLHSFDAFMWTAARLRLQVPDLKNVWLSTEMQGVIDSVNLYPSWSFMFTNNARQQHGTPMHVHEQHVGLEESVGTSFANLLIASEADYFVAALGSNWNRLIDELRMTNSRANAPIITLNYDQW